VRVSHTVVKRPIVFVCDIGEQELTVMHFLTVIFQVHHRLSHQRQISYWINILFRMTVAMRRWPMHLIILETLSDIHSYLLIRVSSSFCWNDRVLTLFPASRSVHTRFIWIKRIDYQEAREVGVFWKIFSIYANLFFFEKFQTFIQHFLTSQNEKKSEQPCPIKLLSKLLVLQ